MYALLVYIESIYALKAHIVTHVYANSIQCIHVCIKRQTQGPTTTIYINNHEPWLYVIINMDII